jgi:hypothetical protein
MCRTMVEAITPYLTLWFWGSQHSSLGLHFLYAKWFMVFAVQALRKKELCRIIRASFTKRNPILFMLWEYITWAGMHVNCTTEKHRVVKRFWCT